MKRKLLFLGLVLSIALCQPVLAEDSVSGALDVTEEQQNLVDNGIPTPEVVAQLKKEADDYYSAKDYENAAVSYEKLAKKSNYLANLISQGLEPFYSKRSDDSYDSKYVFALAPYEKQSNEYKQLRNTAFVKQALCYYYLNDYETALPLLDKALDLIQVDDTQNWDLARNALYDIIGIAE